MPETANVELSTLQKLIDAETRIMVLRDYLTTLGDRYFDKDFIYIVVTGEPKPGKE